VTAIHYAIIGAIVLLTLGLRHYLDRRTHGKPALEAERPWRLRSHLVALVWAAGFIAVESIPDEANKNLVFAAIIVVALLGAASIWAEYRHLMKADELTRKIEIEAMAWAFAFCILGFLTVSQLVTAKLIPEPDVDDTLMGMFAVVIICRLTVIARYR
jgi:hypothetical protein